VTAAAANVDVAAEDGQKDRRGKKRGSAGRGGTGRAGRSEATPELRIVVVVVVRGARVAAAGTTRTDTSRLRLGRRL
jgi:hypothetical protein